MFAAAQSFLSRTQLSANYTIHSPAQPGSFSSAAQAAAAAAAAATGSPAFGRPAAAGAAGPAPGSEVAPFAVGLWRIVRATNKTTQKVVSVWMFEKKALDHLKGNKEGALAVLRKEATSLSRLRHPCVLEMVEPMEETRYEITFATEPITSSLSGTLASARPGGVLDGVDLDETEIQKGILQIAHGLSFLHTQAKLIHNNLSPDAILINAKGDWKLGALNMTTPLEGGSERWSFPEWDARMPESVQRKFDYMDPEYALDEKLSTASDLYALGCVLYAVHLGGRPPFQCHNSLATLRQNADRLARGDIGSSTAMAKLGNDLKDLLSSLITRTSANRLSALTMPSQPFFSNLAISTLLFLDRATFSSKPREEKATFLRGLLRVIPQFSERLRKRKILPSLLEEMKDPWLLPFLLPNIFEIAKGQTKAEFNDTLPSLQPLFALTDPPQNMLTLLDSLPLFVEKTSSAVFREHVMPLVYNSLENEHLEVQERGLKAIPALLEQLDVGTVQEILFVKVAILFTKTRSLSVKVSTLECFLSMIKVLDKISLTQKLVPLLSKVKTKEPEVMMAILSVHEAMGAKVDREAVATHVLPQLWAFSMGPLLNVDQFGRFMATIKSLGARIEAEHAQFLRENHRLRSQAASYSAQANGGGAENGAGATEVSFESLVNGAGRAAAPVANGGGGAMIASDPWGDDPWDSVPVTATTSLPTFSPPPPSQPSYTAPPPQPLAAPIFPRTTSTTSNPRGSLGARPVPASTFNASAFPSPPPPPAPAPLSSFQPLSPTSSHVPALPTSFPTLYPTSSSLASPPASTTGPNYSNFSSAPTTPSIFPSAPLAATRPPTLQPTPSSFASTPMMPMTASKPVQQAAPPGWGSSMGVMQPSRPAGAGAAGGGSAASRKQVQDEFDPFA